MPTKAQKDATAQAALDRLQQFINEIVAKAKRGQKREIREYIVFVCRERAEHGYTPQEEPHIDKEVIRAVKQGLKDLKAGKKVHRLIKQIAAAQPQQFS